MGKLTFQLFLVSLLMAMIGVIFIYSTSAYLAFEQYGDEFYYAKRQLIWIAMGLAVQIFCMKKDSDWYKHFAPKIMMVNIFLLLLVLVPFFSLEAGGARRWLRIFSFSLQPSEFCKLALVMFMAYILTLRAEETNKDQHRKYTAIMFGSLAMILALILAERDLGTTVILAAVATCMLFVSGMNLRYLFILGIAAAPVLYMAIAKYAFRMQRILIYWDPWQDPYNTGYQIIQSMIAIASGGVTGKGLGQSIQKYYYLPEAHTDFIFSIYAEETGLVGSIIVVILFIMLITLGMKVAMRCRDVFSQFLAAGITTLFGLQALINIGVATALLPTKGTTLPFFSFGGTSLIVNMMAVGILIGIEKHRPY